MKIQKTSRQHSSVHSLLCCLSVLFIYYYLWAFIWEESWRVDRKGGRDGGWPAGIEPWTDTVRTHPLFMGHMLYQLSYQGSLFLSFSLSVSLCSMLSVSVLVWISVLVTDIHTNLSLDRGGLLTPPNERVKGFPPALLMIICKLQ